MSVSLRAAACVVVLATAALVAYLLYQGNGLPTNATSKPAHPLPASMTAASTDSAQAKIAPRAAPRPFSRSEWGYRWDPSKPGIAVSAEDAAWLESKGYPGPDVEDHLMRLSVEELRALADRGNQPATAVLAYRLATRGGSHEEVLDLLHGAAANGSVYALKTAGDIFMTVDGFRDPAAASAYYGLQARGGDHGGTVQKYLLFHHMNDRQRLMCGLLEESLWRELGDIRWPASAAEARPGFDTFLSDEVEVAR